MILEVTPDISAASPPRSDAPTRRLVNHPSRVLDTGLAILVWLAVIGVVLWSLAHVAGAVLLFALGAILAILAILAYALTPLVGRRSRIMPRWLALIIVYLGLLLALAGVILG
jgi:hypothetical protein